MGTLFIIGIVQAFFILILLLNKKGKSRSDKILALWMFVLGIHLILYYLVFKDYHKNFPLVLGIMAPLPLVHGPFLLFYINSLISPHPVYNKLQLLHLLPAISYYFCLLPIFLLPLAGQQAFVFEQLPVDPPLYVMIFDALIDVSGITYVIWSLLQLRRHRENIGDNFSYTDRINLIWLRNIILGMAIIWLTVLIGNFMNESTSSSLVFCSVVLFIFLTGYYGIRQGIIFTDQFDFPEPPEPEPSKTKYQRSGLSKEQTQKYLQQLLDYMKNEKPHLDSKLNLPRLAGQLEINPNYVSQIINDQLQQNFYDFVNQYRVEEFKDRLHNKTSGRYTLLAHARASGFSSKSSFNEAFKKLTGQTPSAYNKSLRSTI